MKKPQSSCLIIPAAVFSLWFGLAGAADAAAKERSAVGLPAPPPTLAHALEIISTGIEIVGVAIIVIGTLLSVLLIARDWSRHACLHDRYKSFRGNVGRSILLGLEFLVAADIIGTVAAVPTFESLGLLAIVILIRTFLSFSLETEIQGRLPWRETELDRKRTSEA